VRFDSDAAYAAAFVGAVLAGRDASWMFERLEAARGLPPVAALLVARRLTGSDLLGLVVELVEQGSWEALVVRASPADAARLSAAIRRSVPPEAPSDELVARANGILANAVTAVAARGADAHRLLVLGRALLMSGPEPGLVSAVLGSPGAPETLGGEGADPTPRSWSLRPVGDGAEDGHPAQPSRRRAPGAAAFLIATSVEAMASEHGLVWLADDTHAAAGLRVDLFGRILGLPPNDPGARIAAGLPAERPPDEPDPVLTPSQRRDLARATAGVVPSDEDRNWLDHLAAATPSSTEPANEPDDLRDRVGLAALLGRTFLRRLVGFQSSPLPYLVPRLFGSVGTISIDRAAITVELECPPLLVVLQLAGLADFVVTLPWLDPIVVVRHEATA
jgi:hypothetical protein